MFFLKIYGVYFIVIDVLQSSEKTEFLSNGKNVLMETLVKASEDAVFNLPIDKKESPGNKAVSLAKELVKREMENQHKEIFEVFGGNLAYWFLLLVNTNRENSMVRQSQCRNYLPTKISTSDQRCFNVVDQRWNNVDPTLKMNQNPMLVFQRCTTLIQRYISTLKQRRSNVAQRWSNVETTAQSWNDVETTLHNFDTISYQHCFNVASMLLELFRNQLGYWMWICK